MKFYQARKKLDESQHLPAGVIGPINDKFSDVTFALFTPESERRTWRLLVRDAEGLLANFRTFLVKGNYRQRARQFTSPSPTTVWRR